jgi:hypothetical protein
MKITKALGLSVMLMAMFAFASCDKETEMTKMISADRVEFAGINSDLFEINADSVMVKLIPIGAHGDQWEVRTILPISNTEPWSKIPGSDQSQSSFIYGVSIYPEYLDRNDTELDLSVEMDSQDLIAVLKSEEMITKDVPIKEHSYGNKSYKKQKAYFDMIDGAKLTVDLSWAHKANTSDSSLSSSSTSGSTSSSSQNWDKMLDEYEKYVNEYITYVKKLSNGDKSVESTVDKYFWAADDLEDELDHAYESGKMTSAQKKRFEKILEKFTDAVFDYDE